MNEPINFSNDGKPLSFEERLYRDWLNAFHSVDIPAITSDTCARIMAIVNVHGGGEEDMVLSPKITNDVQYIQQRFHIQGGEIPDRDFARLMRHYVRELEDYMKRHPHDKTSIPEWAHKLLQDRYGIKLHG